MGKYYNKKIGGVEFWEIKYREIHNISDYERLRESVEKAINKDIINARFEIEKKILEAESNKEISMAINLPLITMATSGLISYVISLTMSTTENIVGILCSLFISMVYIIVVLWIIVKRAREIHKFSTDSIQFYNNIKNIILHMLDKK